MFNIFKIQKETNQKITEAVNEYDKKYYKTTIAQLLTEFEELKNNIKELNANNKLLDFKINNPKKYKLGQVVSGFTIFEINYISSVNWDCRLMMSESWEYKGINKQGEIRTIS